MAASLGRKRQGAVIPITLRRELNMRSHSLYLNVAIIGICLCGFGGCGSSRPAAEGEHGAEAAHADEHAHAEEGPHGGHIIELGNEDHHAELTHDETAHIVGVYFLGSDAKTATPIEAESVMINVSLDGEPSQYTLPAKPQDGEGDGKSSYYELQSEPLEVVVSGKSEAKKSHARLNVTIGGKPYVGLIETQPHDHDHDHGHAH
jgi:hypothetical protein